MIFLLDTNACIAVITGNPPQVRRRFRQAAGEGGTIAVSTIVLSELWYGASRSGRPTENGERVQAFAAEIQTFPFDNEAAKTAGTIRAALARSGTPIGAYDCLIAGHAMRLGATLVTDNVREFQRIEGLNWRNWAE